LSKKDRGLFEDDESFLLMDMEICCPFKKDLLVSAAGSAVSEECSAVSPFSDCFLYRDPPQAMAVLVIYYRKTVLVNLEGHINGILKCVLFYI